MRQARFAEDVPMTFGERFLTYPDLFPTRHSGEPCGEQAVLVNLPAGPYLFTGLNEDQEQGVRARFQGLCLPPGETAEPAVTTNVYRVGSGELRSFDLHGWVYQLDLDFAPDRVRIAGLRLLASLSWEPDLTGALWTSEQQPDAFPWLIFENYFRILVAYRLLDRGGALLHSAAVVDNGMAHVFLGPSGAGKTTVSRLALAAGRAVLSDDLNALVPTRNGPSVAKLPFAGELGGVPSPGDRFPVRALHRLVKGDRNTAKTLAPAQTLALLISCAPTVNQDPHRFSRLADNLANLLDSVTAYELTFAQTEELWAVLPSLTDVT
jgi:hypothetical protein